MLYSCGIRVTELCNLEMSNLFIDEDLIRVMGKGNKERMLPLGVRSKKYLDDYIKYSRISHIKKSGSSFVFVSKNGNQLTRAMIYIILNLNYEKNIIYICLLQWNKWSLQSIFFFS